MSSNQFIPVTLRTLAVGKPVPHSIFTAQGELLLSQGQIVKSGEQAEALLQGGFFKTVDLHAGKPTGPEVRPPEGKAKPQSPTGPEPQDGEPKEEQVALDEVRWQIGETFFLHQQSPSMRYTSRLIGYIKNKTVLVTMPMVDDKYVLIREGQMFILRAFSGKKAYAFSAFVVKTVHTPQPYLHLSYPRQISCATIRRRARIPVNLIAAISLENAEESMAAVIMDMSLGGASALIKHPLGEVGERSRIKFKINAVGETVFMDVAGILRSIVPVEHGGCRHGYEFADLSTHDRLVLSAYFHQAEMERN